MTRKGGRAKKGRIVRPNDEDQVSQYKKGIETERSMMHSQMDSQMDGLSLDNKSCLDASMISCTDASLINEQAGSESMTDAAGLDSTRLFQSAQTLLDEEKKADSNSMFFKIEATIDDEEIAPCANESQNERYPTTGILGDT
jgi:hypothetical protein